MKYTKNYQFKKPDSDDACDIGNENDNMDLIDSTLKNIVDNVDIELNAALLELWNATEIMGTDSIIFLTKIKQFETGLQNFTNNDNSEVEISIVKKLLTN